MGTKPHTGLKAFKVDLHVPSETSINEQKVQNAQKSQRSLKSLDLPYVPFRLLSDRDRFSENRVSDKVNTNRKRAVLCAKRKGTRTVCVF